MAVEAEVLQVVQVVVEQEGDLPVQRELQILEVEVEVDNREVQEIGRASCRERVYVRV